MNVVGEAVANYVSNQIGIRQKTYGSANASTRPLADTLFLNQRIAFARLVSGVDIDDPSKLKGDIKNIITSNNLTGNKLASKFILFAGTSERDTKNSKNLLATGVTRDGSSINSGAYGLGGLDFGLKPMPGVTSIDIKSENRGSLRTANIKIKAWNTTQFDIIDILYLRLGYSIFLEWGNVSYIDNGGNPQTTNQYSLVDRFLSGGPFQGEKTPPPSITPSLPTPVEGTASTTTSNSQGEANITALLDNIALLRKQSAGNYDAFYGKVINFSWSFAEDGSYDIDLELRSVGDVVESLRMNVLINDKTTEEEQQEEETDEEPTIESYKDKNQFGRLFYNSANLLDSKGEYPVLKGVSGNNGATYYKSPSGKVNLLKQLFDGPSFWDFWDNNMYYIRFGALLYFIQNSVLPLYKNGNSKTPLFFIDYTTETNLAYYNQFQVSSDPRVCVIKTTIKGTYNNNPETWYLGAGGDPYATEIEGIKVGQIMNIYVNMLHVLQLIDGNTTDGEVSLIEFLTNLCSDISSALGGVNSFEPFIDEELNTLKIIDQTPLSGRDLILPKLGKKLPKDTTTIQLYGYKVTENPETKGRSFLGNFVRNYGIKTELTNAFATTVTIGAQARGSVVGENSTALSKLNAGLIDRIKPEIINSLGTGDDFDLTDFVFKIKDSSGNYLDPYSQAPSETETKLAELEQKFPNANKNYSEFVRQMSSTSDKPLPVYDEAKIDSYCTALNTFLKYLEAKSAIKENKSSGTEGFLPVSVELTLDGISGIKIYNGLNLDTRFLPSNYPETMDFLVTNLSHKIENNIWTTSLGTVMVPNNTTQAGGDYASVDAKIQEGSLRVGFDVNGNPIDVPNRALDPAPKINPSKIGATGYNNSALAQSLIKANYKNAYLPNKELVGIDFAVGGKGRKLHKDAAAALKVWITELTNNKIPYNISSAYRDYKQQASLAKNQNNAASAGSSPHGWGGAVDFGNLYRLVGGSTNPARNLNGRVKPEPGSYTLIAQIGAKYGWYNPWRLSDNAGVDELWHFEYWGPLNPSLPQVTPPPLSAASTQAFEFLAMRLQQIYNEQDPDILFTQFKGTFNDNEEGALAALDKWFRRGNIQDEYFKLTPQDKRIFDAAFTKLKAETLSGKGKVTFKASNGTKTYIIDSDF
jgi:LAS superfamily LD-carboxypeptidase LdcB